MAKSAESVSIGSVVAAALVVIGTVSLLRSSKKPVTTERFSDGTCTFSTQTQNKKNTKKISHMIEHSKHQKLAQQYQDKFCTSGFKFIGKDRSYLPQERIY